jgi:cobalt/nickel transport system permease protein
MMSRGSDLIGLGPLSRLDPRVAVVVLAVWSATLALVRTRSAVLAGLAGSLALVLLAGVERPGRLIKRLLLVNSFLVLVWLVLPFSISVPGEAVAAFGPLIVTREGLDLTISLTLKAIGITCGAMALTASAGVFELVLGARALGAPAKLVAMMSLMTRYVQVARDELDRLLWAMRIRGFVPRASLHCLRSYANLAGVLLVRGLDRGERVRAAMLCRGWRGGLNIARDYRLGAVDFRLSGLILAMLAVVATLDVLS